MQKMLRHGGNMIGIRTDANDVIAMGHLMRCMSIAKQLKNKGNSVIFIVSERCAEEIVNKNGYACICLDNDYKAKNNEIDKMINIIIEKRIDKILIDSYEVNCEYFDKLKKHTRIIYIDDMNMFKYPVDCVINYTYNTDKSIYEKWNYVNTNFLLGSKYVPLRKEFGEERILVKNRIEGILFTTGGTDQYDVIYSLLQKMKNNRWKHINKYVIVGKFYNNIDRLIQMSKEDNTVVLYQNVDNVHEIMKKCDIAVSAGGTTLAELCACGVPTICFSMADNQLSGTKAYSEDSLMVYEGDVREEKEKVVNKIIYDLEKLSNNFVTREAMSKRSKAAIDGKGSLRIAEFIESL